MICLIIPQNLSSPAEGWTILTIFSIGVVVFAKANAGWQPIYLLKVGRSLMVK